MTACSDPATTDETETGTGPTDTGSDSETSSPTTTTSTTNDDWNSGGDLDVFDPPPPDLVEVGHAREFRGVWVTTVYNINWPSSTGLDVAAAQAELLDIVEVAESLHLNAIVFQIRPESDAVYPSALEPWSRFLTGTQGADPGWDPLAFLLTEAHARNLEVHAWINPYRAAASAGAPLAAPHIALLEPEHAHTYGAALWMDPGSVEVREHVVDVVVDVVERYPIDGIHLDDYFYPYPNGNDFPDGLTWNAYDGNLARDDWRRSNVNALVEELHDSIQAADPDVRFGISPFGIYRPGIPAGIVGLDQYAELYADPLHWLEQGLVDYLAPQLYWPTTYAQQDYEVLLDWWTQQSDRYVFTGNYLSKLGTAPEWSLDELLTQVEISRLYRDQNSLGNIFFQVAPMLDDTLGVNAALVDEFYAQPVLTPPLFERLDVAVEPPTVELDGTTAWLEDPAGQRLRGWAVYRDDSQVGQFVLDRLVPIADTPAGDSIELGPGRWAIAAVGWHNVESLGVVVDL